MVFLITYVTLNNGCEHFIFNLRSLGTELVMSN